MVASTDSSLNEEKILIIEADASLGKDLVEALRQKGYKNVTLITNGADGIAKIYDILPHLILLDLTLPDMTGYDVLAKKQSEKMLVKIPVFLLSTQGVPINMRYIPQGSVKEFVMAMHADPETIVSKVERHFGHVAGVSGSHTYGSGRKKILWAEDDKLIGSILSRKLIASGFDLLQAKDGEEALKLVQNIVPDAIVVDLLLPGMSGFDILMRINQDERLKSVPKMVLSNLSKPSDIERAKLLGAKKFLVKAASSLDQIVAEVRDLSK